MARAVLDSHLRIVAAADAHLPLLRGGLAGGVAYTASEHERRFDHESTL
jgi:hypothetical protein